MKQGHQLQGKGLNIIVISLQSARQ